uniref:NADH-ubiquinone oxidoreductase chain 2 n=1 Tax=Xyela sp. ZJUH_2016036 TaxID=2491173 RepID=A0A3Q8UA70_9HYME|nr:NADH dehydrogenase subunit 2 [Xyela sp. ZJUH_2016036]
MDKNYYTLFLMFNNPSKLIFISTLIIGTMISISSNSWFGAWMGLEINLLSFIPLIMNHKNLLSNEASLKYFLTQAIASSILMMTTILMSMSNEFINLPSMNNNFINMMMLSSLFLKSGTAPFHFWFPSVMEGLNWNNCLILMTWQKIAPLMLMSYCLNEYNIKFMMIIISISVIIGAIGGLNQTSMRKLMAYSSINHLGWMIASMLISETLWNFYLMMYIMLSSSIVMMLNTFNIIHINQSFLLNNNNNIIKFSMYLTLLSLGGLPPFIGFLPKWMTIEMLIKNNFLILTLIMIIMTLITLFYYLRISFSSFMLTYFESKWKINFNFMYNLKLTLMLTTISTLGLPLCSLMIKLM